MSERNIDIGKTFSDLRDAQLILEDNIRLFHSGRRHAYKVVAAQLRILLCDTNRGEDNSILGKLIGTAFSDFRFHPLLGGIDHLPESLTAGLVLNLPGGFDVSEAGVSARQLFYYEGTPLPLKKWLDQKFLNKDVTLRSFIKSVSEKMGGCHSDDQYDETSLLALGIAIGGEESQMAYIIAIGEYVHWYIDDPKIQKCLV